MEFYHTAYWSYCLHSVPRLHLPIFVLPQQSKPFFHGNIYLHCHLVDLPWENIAEQRQLLHPLDIMIETWFSLPLQTAWWTTWKGGFWILGIDTVLLWSLRELREVCCRLPLYSGLDIARTCPPGAGVLKAWTPLWLPEDVEPLSSRLSGAYKTSLSLYFGFLSCYVILPTHSLSPLWCCGTLTRATLI